MCSTRSKLVMTAAVVAFAAGAGCQKVVPPAPMALNNEPIVVDEAMQRRDFEPVTAYWANGVTVAGPTGVYFEPHNKVPPGVARGAVESPLFVMHTILLPFDMLWDPWWEDVAYPRGQSEAATSYTHAPPSDRTY